MRTGSVNILIFEEGKKKPEKIATITYPICGQDRKLCINYMVGIADIGYFLAMENKKLGTNGKLVIEHFEDHFDATAAKSNKHIDDESLTQEARGPIIDIKSIFKSKKTAEPFLPSLWEFLDSLVVMLYDSEGNVTVTDISRVIPHLACTHDLCSRG